ncbi:hypothetical protein HNO88_002793 [Novosphingobium chloroacetimidivorans]|uniref:Uncharacterized protein n=1 Tax=Novosphingobium chloroacetimidivorans TaxID=1428314 RepID=A0A7W7KBY7_9SPHN|nr:hypothetical protein [Novosphingobium chloroacetimidivorans]MBB4859464.1 hypothetical protein [Novosphingobium chloroacetimidivorans]
MPAAVRQRIDEVNRKVATAMLKRGKIITPRTEDAPHLGDSIELTVGDSRLMEYSVSVGDSALVYAVPLEFGHVARDGSHVPANPFWVPLTRIYRKRHRSNLRTALRKVFKQELGL